MLLRLKLRGSTPHPSAALEPQSAVFAEHVFVSNAVTGAEMPAMSFPNNRQKCSIHLFRCHSMRRTRRRRYVTCPVRSGCQASVHNLDIEMAGNWKTDAGTAPERLSSATGGVPFARLGQQTGSSRQGCSRSGRASKRIEGRFHGEARELLTSCVRCEDRSADATQRLSPPALLIFIFSQQGNKKG
ncbi:hypothetical protein EYF80_002068 [Liparis tanakae]|uniref:Uncharacterized protein n=1 Tax=Liparis tanakae TaxID=230148 RepID=A0A4Z2JCH9_9TELE|nr:hypothetical protein EYF80_002068 [Liparis tanakae]